MGLGSELVGGAGELGSCSSAKGAGTSLEQLNDSCLAAGIRQAGTPPSVRTDPAYLPNGNQRV